MSILTLTHCLKVSEAGCSFTNGPLGAGPADSRVTGHVLRSASVRINYSVKECLLGGTTGGYVCQDNRLNAWGSSHPGGANLLFCDGSTRFVAESLSLITLAGWSTPAGEELVTE